VLSGDLLNLSEQLHLLEQAGVELLHVDVMDGCFVPQMTVGPPLIKALCTSMLKDVHLMISDPVDKVLDYVRSGADMVTCHVESGPHVHRALQILGDAVNENDAERGVVRGLAISPGTPVHSIEPFVDLVDVLFLLAINPGWSGQAFLPSMARRISEAREIIESAGERALIGVDGAVTAANIADVAAMGADIIVSGSAIFRDGRAAENLAAMQDAIRAAGR
jgi:ribulose-phosphate 3-epimerase